MIAAIFEPLERLDHFLGDRLAPQYSDDPAHAPNMSPALPRTMPKSGLDAANSAKKSQSFTPCVRQSLTQALTFRFRLSLTCRRLFCRRLFAALAGHPIRLVHLT